jgi:hypothetical protein
MRLVITLLLLATAAAASAVTLRCRGVIDVDERTAHVRCRFRSGDVLRRVHATCRDGEPGCDADGACDGTCRFALCADAGCTRTLDVPVALRRDGRRPGRAVVRAGGVRAVLRCRPPRDGCGAGTTTTSSTPVTSSTTTTAPAVPCAATLTGAVSASIPCRAGVTIGGLGLPVLAVAFDAPEAEGSVLVLLAGRRPGTFTPDAGFVLGVLGLIRPASVNTAVPPSPGPAPVVVLDTLASQPVSGTFEAHGRADLTFGTPDGETIRVQAEF